MSFLISGKAAVFDIETGETVVTIDSSDPATAFVGVSSMFSEGFTENFSGSGTGLELRY